MNKVIAFRKMRQADAVVPESAVVLARELAGQLAQRATASQHVIIARKPELMSSDECATEARRMEVERGKALVVNGVHLLHTYGSADMATNFLDEILAAREQRRSE